MKWTTRLKDQLWTLKSDKKAQIVFIVIIVLVVAGIAGFFVFRDTNEGAGGATVNLNTAAEISNGEPGRRFIDGVLVDAKDQNPYPIAVMVENLVTVRPQSGLSNAHVVYEALAEGGITRFMAVFLDGEPVEEIGPIRSARHYYLDWANEFHGTYAHIGGSPQALGAVGNYDVYNLEAMIMGTYFIRKDDIAAPHNLFSSSELLGFAIRDNVGEDLNGDFDPWLFKDDAEEQDRGDVDNILVDFSSFSYQVTWEYDRETNDYKRSNGGAPHTDRNTLQQIRSKNVVVQFADTSLLEADTGRIDVQTIGEGRAVVFQDGIAIEGTWKKEDEGSRTRYYNGNGAEISMNAGPTWVEIVPTGRDITY